jgi:hypothetical protein
MGVSSVAIRMNPKSVFDGYIQNINGHFNFWCCCWKHSNLVVKDRTGDLRGGEWMGADKNSSRTHKGPPRKWASKVRERSRPALCRWRATSTSTVGSTSTTTLPRLGSLLPPLVRRLLTWIMLGVRRRLILYIDMTVARMRTRFFLGPRTRRFGRRRKDHPRQK